MHIRGVMCPPSHATLPAGQSKPKAQLQSQPPFPSKEPSQHAGLQGTKQGDTCAYEEQRLQKYQLSFL